MINDNIDSSSNDLLNQDRDLFKLVSRKTENKSIGTIMAEPDLKLMLLRHWTLYDSIQNSSYMISKFILQKEPGQDFLKKFFVSLGCPLEQAK
mmetsp:Transcript_13945/g.9832  ORF Transcript_13945/g.9832 Transcript_13945/m.9832 type:complete len:93 (+) Transcript_13945:267-545(+)